MATNTKTKAAKKQQPRPIPKSVTIYMPWLDSDGSPFEYKFTEGKDGVADITPANANDTLVVYFNNNTRKEFHGMPYVIECAIRY